MHHNHSGNNDLPSYVDLSIVDTIIKYLKVTSLISLLILLEKPLNVEQLASSQWQIQVF